MICKGCGFPFPPHELREEHCFECVWKRLQSVKPLLNSIEALLSGNRGPSQSECAEYHGHGSDQMIVQMDDYDLLESEYHNFKKLYP